MSMFLCLYASKYISAETLKFASQKAKNSLKSLTFPSFPACFQHKKDCFPNYTCAMVPSLLLTL